MKRFINRTVTFFSIAGLISFAVLMIICGKEKQPAEKHPIAHLPQKTLYKTIYNPDNALDVVGFELHEDEPYDDGNTKCACFNAVVRNLDPDKDNYKSICRDIITDIIHTCGDKEVRVNIYDSFEAYKLAVDDNDGRRILTTKEEQYANEHRVATYCAAVNDDYYGEDAYCITFYPDACNRRIEKEMYSFL